MVCGIQESILVIQESIKQMIQESILTVLEDGQATAYDKWNAIQKIEASGEAPFLEVRADVALTKLLDHDSELIRHAVLHLYACKGQATDSRDDGNKKVAK